MRAVVSILLSVLFSGVFAQRESYNWYFGIKAGIQFSPTGNPSVLTNSAMKTAFGCASISDSCTGQLQFYTNGDTVWNRNHQKMPNGSGLGGNTGSTQSAIIVPKPASSNGHLYIFTVGASTNSGLKYSIVNMNLASGLGDVISGQKKIDLVSPTLEKVTAVRHTNNVDVWIVTHTLNTDKFYAYLLTATGINPPVITSVGPVYTSNDQAGYMKVSPNGSLLCLALSGSKQFDVYDFDNSSGVVSNLRQTASTYNFAHGVEFSPDGTKLYVSSDPNGLFQYDLSTASTSPPLGNLTYLGKKPSELKALQLGPDGKIYVGEVSYLGVIHEPNVSGSLCNYQPNFLKLAPGSASSGLPTFMQSYFSPVTIVEEHVCHGVPTDFHITLEGSLDSVIWNFGDPASGTANSSALKTPSHLYSSVGSYLVTAYVFTKKCGIYYPDTATKTIQIVKLPIPVVDLGNDTSICRGDSIDLVTDGQQPTYIWNTNSTAAQIRIGEEGIYWVRASNLCGTLSDSIKVEFIPENLNVNLGRDTSICEGDRIYLYAKQERANYKWSTGSDNHTIVVEDKGSYWVEVSNVCELKSDTIKIGLKHDPLVNLGSDTLICDGEELILNATYPNSTYLWQDYSAQPTYLATKEGFYSVRISNECGNSRAQIYLRVKDCNCHVQIPNAFTPNNDRVNDDFHIMSACEFIKFELTIYNRWGAIVYKSSDPNTFWDGKIKSKSAASGLYSYRLVYKSSDPMDEDDHDLSGLINLLK